MEGETCVCQPRHNATTATAAAGAATTLGTVVIALANMIADTGTSALSHTHARACAPSHRRPPLLCAHPQGGHLSHCVDAPVVTVVVVVAVVCVCVCPWPSH